MNFLEWDIFLLRKIYNPFYLEQTNLFVSLIFSIYLFLLFLIYFHYKKKHYSKVKHLLISSFSGYCFVAFLKFLIGRKRPYEVVPGIVSGIIKSDPSFPSAHSFLSFLMFSFVPKTLPWKFRIPIYLYLLAIPIANLVIGVHFPSDVVAGSILGLIWPRIVNERFCSKIFKKIGGLRKWRK